MSTFRKALQDKDFVIAAELPLSANMSGRSVVASAAKLMERVDGLVLTDNRFGQTHMSSLAAASLLLRENIDPVLQLSCRNRNRIAILSELLGARAIGVSSLYLVQGEKIPEALKPRPKSVMDMQVKELVATARMINDDEELENAEPFLIGTSALVHKPVEGWKPDELQAKCDAGAQLLFTQLCFDVGVMRDYLAMLVGEGLVRRASIVANIGVLPSGDYARWIRENRRRALLPDALIERLEKASDSEREGIAICSELIRDYSEVPGIAGVSVSTTGGMETIVAAIEGAG